MHLSYLPNEIALHVLQSCDDIPDVLSLGATCRRLHSILHASSNRLPTLFLAAESQYGPLADAFRLVTHNESQAAHVPRPTPPQSLALLQQLVYVGRIANSWAELYPSVKWRGESSRYRRFLSGQQRYILRRAVYRSWLYSLAFHTPSHDRTSRRSPLMVRQRALLLRPWMSSELAELLDLQSIFRALLASTITPSNGTVIRRHKQRYPDDPFPLISVTHPAKYAAIHRTSCSAPLNDHDRLRNGFHSNPHASHLLPFAPSDKYARTQKELHGTTLEGWGDEITHYYVVEDMLKLDPGKLLHLYTTIMEITQGGNFHAGQSAKGIVESFIAELEGAFGWFENNGETLGETIGFVVGERGDDGGELRAMVEDGSLGIAIGEHTGT